MTDARADLRTRIREMIVDRLFLDIAPAAIGDGDDLMRQHGLDSVNLFEVAMGLEEEFGVAMADEDFTTDVFASVASIAEFVQDRQG